MQGQGVKLIAEPLEPPDIAPHPSPLLKPVLSPVEREERGFSLSRQREGQGEGCEINSRVVGSKQSR
jgi:hypothetical protein